MRKELFVTDNFYHLYNRGVDKRTIFLDYRDYERFLISLYLFNDSKLRDYDMTRINLRSLASCLVQDRKPLVEIIHWCLMPNHFHILVNQQLDNGITNFMHKLGTGYTKYFNKRYDRKGRLFGDTFKAKLVSMDDYFSHLGTYIPLNPLDLYRSNWKENGINKADLSNAEKYLLSYKWSSYRDYFGQSVIPGLITKGIFLENLGGTQEDYKNLINQFLLDGVLVQHEAKLRSYEA